MQSPADAPRGLQWKEDARILTFLLSKERLALSRRAMIVITFETSDGLNKASNHLQSLQRQVQVLLVMPAVSSSQQADSCNNIAPHIFYHCDILKSTYELSINEMLRMSADGLYQPEQVAECLFPK